MTSQSNFHYIGSWDELTWTFDVSKNINVYRCMIPWHIRPEIKEWIDTCCGGTVYLWNGTSTPEAGSMNWGAMLAPSEERCYLIFTNYKDESMFCIKYTEQLKVMVNRNLQSAWRDSRRS